MRDAFKNQTFVLLARVFEHIHTQAESDLEVEHCLNLVHRIAAKEEEVFAFRNEVEEALAQSQNHDETRH